MYIDICSSIDKFYYFYIELTIFECSHSFYMINWSALFLLLPPQIWKIVIPHRNTKKIIGFNCLISDISLAFIPNQCKNKSINCSTKSIVGIFRVCFRHGKLGFDWKLDSLRHISSIHWSAVVHKQNWNAWKNHYDKRMKEIVVFTWNG